MGIDCNTELNAVSSEVGREPVKYVEKFDAPLDFFDVVRLENPDGQRDIFDACKATAKYIETEDINTVVLIDRSARAMWPGLRAYSKRMTGKAPEIFFVDNKGFERAGTDERLIDQFKRDHPYLLGHKDETILLLDTCIHQGEVIKPIIAGFQRAGFKDIRFGVVSEHNNRSDIKPDVVLLDRKCSSACYPFGQSNLTAHTKETLHAKPRGDVARILPTATFIRRRMVDIAEGKQPGHDADEVAVRALTELMMRALPSDMLNSRKTKSIQRKLMILDMVTRASWTISGSFWTMMAIEKVTDSHAPPLPTSLGSLALNAGFQAWRQSKKSSK